MTTFMFVGAINLWHLCQAHHSHWATDCTNKELWYDSWQW